MKKTSTKKAQKKYFSWPKEALKRGRVSNADLPLYHEFIAEKKRLERRENKRKRDREAKAAKRAARIAAMAPNVAGTAQHDAIQGWGSTSTARLTESKTYPWHGAFTVSGLSSDALNRVLSRAGSLKRNPTKNSDGTYSVTITPWLTFGTPNDVFAPDANGSNELARAAEQKMAQYRSDGAAHITYHGAFYNKFFEGE